MSAYWTSLPSFPKNACRYPSLPGRWTETKSRVDWLGEGKLSGIIYFSVINQLDAQKVFFHNKFISSLCMFRAPCAHRQEVKIVLYSLWYHHTCRWPSRAQVERRSGDWIPVGARFSAPVQTVPAAHPASCTIVTGSFPGAGRGVDHPPPSSAEVKERVELYLYSPHGPSWPVVGWTLLYLYLYPYVFSRINSEYGIFQGVKELPVSCACTGDNNGQSETNTSSYAPSQNCEQRQLASSCLSVRPSARKPQLPLDGFLKKFDILIFLFFENISRKLKVH